MKQVVLLLVGMMWCGLAVQASSSADCSTNCDQRERGQPTCEEELLWAGGGGYTQRVKDLLDSGADINHQSSSGLTVLMHATLKKQGEMVKLLIDRGADSNLQRVSGNTALFYAADENMVQIAKLLIAADANLDVQNSIGYTALMVAAGENSLMVAKLLIDAGADVNLKNYDKIGRSALSIAKLFDHHAMAEMLRRAGAEE